MKFWKYEGLGNDFVVVRQSPETVRPDWVVAICDRHFGVGGDGVLVVSDEAGHAGRMTVFNADGTQPEMCGNGVRCVAEFLRRHVSAGDHFTIATDAGPMDVRFAAGEFAVEFERPRILGLRKIEIDGVRVVGYDLTAGNPHLVLIDPPGVDHAVWGAQLQESARGGVNVSFARTQAPNAIDLVVYERGCGLTLACGTGACATVVAAEEAGTVTAGAPIKVTLPGGTLTIQSTRNGTVQMTGPAREVFEGEWSD